MFSSVTGKQQVLMLFLLEIILIAIIGTMMTYGPEANANLLKNHTGTNKSGQTKKPDDDPLRIYPMYQDVHVMIWIGFGFLMTFLKRYSQSAVGLTFLIGALLVQVALICDGMLHVKLGSKAHLSLGSLLSADVAVATPLISMGAILGKVTYMQLVLMGIVELIMFTANKYVGEHLFMVVDAGDSMFVHVFGAYFGLAISFVLGMKDKPEEYEEEHDLEGSSYQSDVFAMIGTVFLWLFWPSFNSAALTGDDQQRAVINTLLSISASCVITFAVSAWVSKDNKFNMVHVQNSTLAGGVAIGTAAGMMCQPVGALVIGAISGMISVLGYKYLTIFPARAPSSEAKIGEMRDNYGISSGLNRTAYQQAGYQLLALVVTLVISIVSGLITGLLLRTMMCGRVTEQQKFDDEVVWELENKFQHKIGKNRIDNTRSNDHIAMGNI
ncbi:Ammonium transporter Rh type B [Temnothorax longispinosus]|uniref:Ammonium transporter Rh type B n=1 Tax=Temnothorax longispinosus TaxID=300112 RepID=A0A4S2KLN4_9HYME|nr:Ammonium transporter Rh type B [Temnothorax longispinosus]